MNRLLDSDWLYWTVFCLAVVGWFTAVTAVFWPVARATEDE